MLEVHIRKGKMSYNNNVEVHVRKGKMSYNNNVRGSYKKR